VYKGGRKDMGKIRLVLKFISKLPESRPPDMIINFIYIKYLFIKVN
jgi:hypothetical protein